MGVLPHDAVASHRLTARHSLFFVIKRAKLRASRPPVSSPPLPPSLIFPSHPCYTPHTPIMAKKKKPASNPARGFATTSIASKPKAVEPPPREPTPPPVPTTPRPIEEWKPPTAEEEEDLLLRSIVDKHGIKVRKESARIATKLKAEKRTLRGSGQCYPLKLDGVFGIFSERSEGAERSLGERILEMAREEMKEEMEKRGRVGRAEEKMLVNTWTLHRIMLGLGFKGERVEEAVREVLGREGRANRDVEVLLDEVMEWMAMYGDAEDMPKYLEASASAAPKKSMLSAGSVDDETLRECSYPGSPAERHPEANRRTATVARWVGGV